MLTMLAEAAALRLLAAHLAGPQLPWSEAESVLTLWYQGRRNILDDVRLNCGREESSAGGFRAWHP